MHLIFVRAYEDFSGIRYNFFRFFGRRLAVTRIKISKFPFIFVKKMFIFYLNFYAGYENEVMTNNYCVIGQKYEEFRKKIVAIVYFANFFFTYFGLYHQNRMRYITFNCVFVICIKIRIGN